MSAPQLPPTCFAERVIAWAILVNAERTRDVYDGNKRSVVRCDPDESFFSIDVRAITLDFTGYSEDSRLSGQRACSVQIVPESREIWRVGGRDLELDDCWLGFIGIVDHEIDWEQQRQEELARVKAREDRAARKREHQEAPKA